MMNLEELQAERLKLHNRLEELIDEVDARNEALLYSKGYNGNQDLESIWTNTQHTILNERIRHVEYRIQILKNREYVDKNLEGIKILRGQV